MTELSGEAVHAAWRDGMIAQGRSVEPERMVWSSLSEQDKQLDDLIALRLHILTGTDANERVAQLEQKLRDIAGASVTNDQPALCKMVKKSITPEAYYEACETHDYEWSECPFRPYTNRILALQKRMAWRAVYTFTRRVDEEWIVPSLSKHYSAHSDGTPYCYSDDPEFRVLDESPSALYPAVIVPKELVGRVIAIRPLETGEGERL